MSTPNPRQRTREELLAGIRAQRLNRLRGCALFSRIEEDELTVLAEAFEELSVPAGEPIISEGAPEPYLYILASGRLEVFCSPEAGEPIRLGTVMPGEPVGEMGCFSDRERSASVRAIEPSELLRIRYEQLTRFFEHSPGLAPAFVDVVAGRLRRMNRLYQENAIRLKTAERSQEHLGHFLDLSEATKLGAGIEGLIERLVRSARSITDADRASLFLIDPATGELWSKVAEGVEVKEIRVSAGAGVIGWVAREKEILNIANAYEDDRFNPDVDRDTGYRTRTILCAPMWSLQHEILGVVQVINKRAGVFDEADEALLRAFAHQAAIAVENFNLYRRMMLSHKKMAIMLDIATTISQTLDIGTLIREIVSKTTQILQCDRASFFVLDHGRQELWSMEAQGSELKEIRFPASAGLAGHAAASGEVVNIPDAYEDARFNPDFDQASNYRTRSVLCVPVVDRAGRITGVTQAINKFDGCFDEEDIELSRAAASQIGVALENAKLHASTVNMKNYLQSVQQSISNSILSLDRDLRVVTANKAAVEMFPAAAKEPAEHDIQSLLGPRNDHIMSLVRRGYESRVTIAEYDVDLHGDDGESRIVNLNVLPLTDAEQQFQGLVLVLEDITNEKRVKSAFSHYLAPAVIEQLLADPNRLTLGGEKREVTFLFTDIAGFTTFSEKAGPAELGRLLNEYFDETCDIVLRHGGTLDKIVGDALHVMFNAPTDQPDHAERAVRCALELAEFCEKFASEQAQRGMPIGATRIGVNTGSAVVGNFGGTARFDYTAYGDSINTAARLESANRYLGTRICASRSAKDGCNGMAFRPVGRLLLKGKSELIEVFEPQAEARSSEERLHDYLHAYGRLESEDSGAAETFSQLSARYPDDGLIAFHHQRLANGETGSIIVLSGK